jgi:hypothetical protein
MISLFMIVIRWTGFVPGQQKGLSDWLHPKGRITTSNRGLLGCSASGRIDAGDRGSKAQYAWAHECRRHEPTHRGGVAGSLYQGFPVVEGCLRNICRILRSSKHRPTKSLLDGKAVEEILIAHVGTEARKERLIGQRHERRKRPVVHAIDPAICVGYVAKHGVEECAIGRLLRIGRIRPRECRFGGRRIAFEDVRGR